MHTRTQLNDHTRIERAKGLIMEHKRLKEDDAYQFLHKTARAHDKQLSEVADNIIDAYVLLHAGV